MMIVLRVVLTLGGLLLLFMGFGFLTDPVTSGADFGLSLEGAHAITSIRADLTAFFSVSGACFLWGIWGQRRDPLLIGSALMLVTLAARLASLAINGSFEGYMIPMGVEAILGIAGLLGAKAVSQNG